MTAARLLEILGDRGIDFFCGVPDSYLRPLCDELWRRHGDDPARHIITHNEGGAVGYAAGHHLATGKVPCVYLQNSGLGNIVNPANSLTSPLVYGIPLLYIVGWRGQPGVADEPQHLYQGLATEGQLALLGIDFFRMTPETSEDGLARALGGFVKSFAAGKSAAILVEKGAISGGGETAHANGWTLNRETAIEMIAAAAGDDIIVSSTGKISRELYEVRERGGSPHDRDFLNIGAMGHDGMVALGIAAAQPSRRVWCVEGDGAFLMHMGQAATIGAAAPRNLCHIILNNAAHESVGGMPTAAGKVDLCGIAAACGYQKIHRAETVEELAVCLREMAVADGLAFLEVLCSLASRDDLGRPSQSPGEMKKSLMDYLRQ